MRKIKNLIGSLCLLLIGLAVGYASPLAQHEHTKDALRIELQNKVAEVYTSQIGVRELTGKNDGVEVERYLAVTGLTKGYAWCAAFPSWVFQEAGVTAIKNAWAPSWFPPAKTIYEKGKLSKLQPDKADVFGIYYSNLSRVGHVGFVDNWPRDTDYFITVEGNTNNAGSREGDGVYRKRRLKANVHKVSRWI